MAKKTQARQDIFAREYVVDLNGTRAAIAAGYSERTANEQASRLLANRKVQIIVDRLKSQRASRLEIKADRVLEELARLAFSNMGDYVGADEDGKPQGLNLAGITRDQWAAVQEIREDTTGGSGDGERKAVLRTTLKLADKGLNLERLGRHLKLFTDKVEVTGIEGLAERMAELRKSKNASGEPRT